jgi:molecular chaperone HscB
MPARFLTEQMEWREALDEASGEAELQALEDQLKRARAETLALIARLLDEDADPQSAAQQVRGLMFIERFGQDVQARFEQLGQ